MTTPRTRSIVSLTAILALCVTLGACASAPARPAAPLLADNSLAPTVPIDNGARTWVNVYLVGERREWLLGRVEPAAHADLRIPAEAVQEGLASLRLVLVSGARTPLMAADAARAAVAAIPLTSVPITWPAPPSFADAKRR